MSRKKSDNVIRFPGKRWPASPPNDAVVEYLEALARDIRKGVYAPAAMFIGLVVPQPDGTVLYPYLSVNLSQLELPGLLAHYLKELS